VDKDADSYKYQLFLSISDGAAPFWIVSQENLEEGIRFYVISDKGFMSSRINAAQSPSTSQSLPSISQ
jgi:hypothetical protein